MLLQHEIPFLQKVPQLVGPPRGTLSVGTCGGNLAGERPLTVSRLPLANWNLWFWPPRETMKRRLKKPPVFRWKLQARQHFFNLLPLLGQRPVVHEFIAIRIQQSFIDGVRPCGTEGSYFARITKCFPIFFRCKAVRRELAESNQNVDMRLSAAVRSSLVVDREIDDIASINEFLFQEAPNEL